MKKRYQLSIIFEVEDEDEKRADNEAEQCESICYSVIAMERGHDTFEDMVWVIDEDGTERPL